MKTNVVLAAALTLAGLALVPSVAALGASLTHAGHASADASAGPGSAGIAVQARAPDAATAAPGGDADATSIRSDAGARPVVPGANPNLGIGAAVGTVVGLGILLAFLKGTILGGAGLPFFSRIDTDRVLENDARRRVFDMIEHNPGATLSEIATALQLGWGTTIYHLNRLEGSRLVVSERHRQFRRFFKNGSGIPGDSKGAVGELKNPNVQRIAAEILHHPGAAQHELCRAVGISAPLAHKYLERMAHAELLTKQREWKTVHYFPTRRLSTLLPVAHPEGSAPAPAGALLAGPV